MSINCRPLLAPIAAALVLALGCANALAYDSGSTGADGVLNPSVSTQVPLPPNGVLNYTLINIPAGVTVTFGKNISNTPVVLLVSGDATVAGTISLNGTAGLATGAAGDGNLADDGIPGVGGPGGFDGGQGGRAGGAAVSRLSQPGLGPGGPGHSGLDGSSGCGGNGGGFGAVGQAAGVSQCSPVPANGLGPSYGHPTLLPIIGGSGGAGGAGGSIHKGAGGGGGGGGIVIAVSGQLTISGTIRANGAAGGLGTGEGVGGSGGGGSGGGIRLIATTISGNGAVTATGGAGHSGTGSGPPNNRNYSADGAVGRVRLEAENLTRTAASTPVHTFGAPGPVFVAGMPTLRITSVGGIPSPAEPTGVADIEFPEGTTNPLTVEVATSGVPLGNTVTVAVRPAWGARVSYVSGGLAGSEASATASVDVDLPPGPSSLLAQLSYSVPAAMAQQSPYRELSRADDPITRITMESTPDGVLRRIATTQSGQELDLSMTP